MVGDGYFSLSELPGWVPVVGVAVVALILGYLFARLRSGGQGTAPTRAEAGSGNQARDLQKSIARLESDNQALTNLFQMLPEYTKKMSSRIDRREIPMHVIKVIEQMFAPTQILIFLLEERLGKMALVKQMGLPPDFPKTFLIAPGEGRIGWVAQSGMAMDTDDFIREKRLGANFEVPAHFPFRIELCAPMMHEDKVRGVISVGGITRHYKHEKSILGLIADQGSIALYNHDLFTKTQEMANCDGLTKLFNKRFFLEKLSTVILEAAKGHHPFSVFIFDLDHFKHYNDTQGHQAGDEVLRTTGELVKSALRPDDFAARYGGEEFIVLLAHAPKEGAMEAAERIRALIADHPYANRESQPLKRVSLSGGVATYPDDGLTSADLIAAADSALYRAKKASRNKVFASEPKYFSDETEDPVYNVQNG